MEWIKVLFDRLFGFLACMVPGSVIFLLLLFHRPDLVFKVWENQALTYETKILISILFGFSFGFSATYLFGAFLRALGGGLGGWLGPPKFPDNAPWHNKHWRRLLGHYLGKRAPEDIDPPLSTEMFDARLAAIRELAGHQALEELARLREEEGRASLNEDEWFGWWHRFHLMSLSAQDPTSRLYETVSGSFQIASLIALVSMSFTPQLRLWWVLTPCLCWLAHFALLVASGIMMIRNPWGTFQKQIDFFQDRLEKNKRLDELED